MNKELLNSLQFFPCFYFIIHFLIFLHKHQYETTRSIVRIHFNKIYFLNYSSSLILVILIFYETVTNIWKTDLFNTFICFIWTFTNILVPILCEIRRRTKNPMCYIIFTYLIFTTSLCLIRYINTLYYVQSVKGISLSDEKKKAGFIFVLHLFQLIFASKNSFTSRNSVLNDNNPCPEEYSSIPSRILFMWLDRYIYSWYQYGINKVSTFHLHYECVADINALNLRKELGMIYGEKQYYESLKSNQEALKRYSVSWLAKALFRVFYFKLIVSWSAIVFHILFAFSRPFILKYLLKFISVPESPLIFGFTLAISFLITGILSSITQNCCFHLTSTASLQVRSALTSAIYSKSIDINNEAKNVFTNAEIVNLMSTDTDKIVTAIAYSWIVISSPFEIILTFAFLFNEIGYLASVGLLVLMGTFPLNSIAMKWLQFYQTEEMEWKDKRIKAMTEVLNHMKVIKLYCWESLFFKIISKNREKEVNLIRLISLCSGVVNIIWDILPMSVLLTTLWAYVNIFPNYTITAEATFVSVVLLNMLRSPMAVLPYGITIAMNGYVSLKRVSLFLIESNAKQSSSQNKTENSVIEIKDGVFSWGPESDPILKNINLNVNKGQLVGIIGKVASGKTSLLNAIIGEMCILNGTINIKGKVSYVPQNPWIQKISTMENILFSKRYNENEYKEVIKACALDFDFESIQKGEWTSGDRMMFSGGQKQRINLARAVYQKSDIYLLDDPLSALDAVVGKKIFERVISNNGILANTTRLFVTQNINFLSNLDRVIFLNESGLIIYDGDVSKICLEDINFMKVKVERYNSEFYGDTVEKNVYTSNNSCVVNRSSCRIRKIFSRTMKEKFQEYFFKSDHRIIMELEKNTNSSNSISFSQSEENDFETEMKSVSYNAYCKYFFARGSFQLLCSIFAFGMMTVLQVFSSYWLEKLTSNHPLPNNSSPIMLNKIELFALFDYHSSANYFMFIYGLIGLGQIIFALLFYFTFSFGNANASKTIHDFMLNKVLKSKLHYFHRSSNQILNFFSRDIDNIDSLIPNNLSEVINCIFQVVASFFVILHTFPAFLLLIIPIGLLYYLMLKFYLPSACQTQMLCIKSSSPIFRYFNETLQGRAIIRASKQHKHFECGIYKLLDKNTQFLYIQNVLNLWLSLRLDFLGNVLVFGSVVMAICYRDKLTPSLVGLTISYSIDIIDLLNWMMIQYVDLETNSMALERLNYFDQMESEFCEENDTKVNLTDWPRCGKIEFKNFYLKYEQDYNYALCNINLTIEHGEKIGIVGRTGSGKTSLAQSLFKLMEPSSGSLCIDDIDIRKLEISKVRSAITMFPQESTIFSGTIRQNIDPFNEFDDYKLKSALKLSHLGSWLETIDENLDFDCGDSGSNLSVGQRQLLCLARVILRNSKIIVLDEATACVDQETDRLIMETIKKRFYHSTLIVVAHRTSGLKHLDKIIVMDGGSIVEYGSAEEVINKPNGYFSKFKMYDQ